MKFKTLLSIALLVAMSSVAFAELQNVEIGGSLRIRGNYFGLDSLGDVSFIEQRTRLNVKADFTQEVSAFIELDAYDVWGEDFRSDHVTGGDRRPVTTDDTAVRRSGDVASIEPMRYQVSNISRP